VRRKGSEVVVALSEVEPGGLDPPDLETLTGRSDSLQQHNQQRRSLFWWGGTLKAARLTLHSMHTRERQSQRRGEVGVWHERCGVENASITHYTGFHRFSPKAAIFAKDQRLRQKAIIPAETQQSTVLTTVPTSFAQIFNRPFVR